MSQDLPSLLGSLNDKDVSVSVTAREDPHWRQSSPSLACRKLRSVESKPNARKWKRTKNNLIQGYIPNNVDKVRPASVSYLGEIVRWIIRFKGKLSEHLRTA